MSSNSDLEAARNQIDVAEDLINEASHTRQYGAEHAKLLAEAGARMDLARLFIALAGKSA